MLDAFLGVFLKLYDQFLAVRADKAAWAGALKDIHTWISGRATKR